MTKFIRTHPDGNSNNSKCHIVFKKLKSKLYMYSGLPEVGLKPLDPLYFGDATIHQQADGPLSMNITITDGSIKGWRNMTVTKVVYE